MSKSTKIIAALGVVAGLGVAALPAFTYAAETTGDVEVDVEVESAIAMTITGNNDDGSHYNGGVAFSYSAVSNPTGDPSAQGWYEEDNGEYTLSEDTTVDGSKTYYIRVAHFNPVDNSDPAGLVRVDGHAAATIDGTSSSYISLLPNATAIGDSSNNFRSTITVYTNNATGYDLTLLDGDTDNDLVNSNGATIDATSATTLTAGTAAWGYRVSGDTDWLAVPISTDPAAPIATLSTKTSGGDTTIVEYGVATAADQATGVYADTIVYTATTK